MIAVIVVAAGAEEVLVGLGVAVDAAVFVHPVPVGMQALLLVHEAYVDVCGYADAALVAGVMRPSASLNSIIDAL